MLLYGFLCLVHIEFPKYSGVIRVYFFVFSIYVLCHSAMGRYVHRHFFSIASMWNSIVGHLTFCRNLILARFTFIFCARVCLEWSLLWCRWTVRSCIGLVFVYFWEVYLFDLLCFLCIVVGLWLSLLILFDGPVSVGHWLYLCGWWRESLLRYRSVWVGFAINFCPRALPQKGSCLLCPFFIVNWIFSCWLFICFRRVSSSLLPLFKKC